MGIAIVDDGWFEHSPDEHQENWFRVRVEEITWIGTHTSTNSRKTNVDIGLRAGGAHTCYGATYEQVVRLINEFRAREALEKVVLKRDQ